MARVIAEGYTTVPWAPGGDPGAWDLAANLSTLAFPDGRTVWDEFCARHGLSANAAWMLRLVGRDTLVEFAAWARQSRSSSPGARGRGSKASGRQAAGAGSSALGSCGATIAERSWRCGVRPASTSTGWPRIRLVGHTPMIPLWGLASLPARWAPQWAVHTHQTGDSDDDPLFGCLRAEDIPEFEPPIRVLEWPVVPTGPFAPGGEGADPPHTAWVYGQSRGRRQDPPPHDWEWVALGRGLAAPGPSRHDDLGQARGCGLGASSNTRRGTIPWLSQIWARRGWDFAPPPRPIPQVLGEGLDEDSHWTAAARVTHSLVGWPSLEPALEAVLEFRREWRHDLARIRQDVLDELRELVEDAEDDTAAWLAPCPRMCAPPTSLRQASTLAGRGARSPAPGCGLTTSNRT